MSTLRTNTLQSIDGSVTVSIADINNTVGLSDKTDVTKGAALVGYRGRTVTDKLSDTIDVRDYGAKCDGSTDDSAAWSKAVAALPSKGGAITWAGVSLITSAITITDKPVHIKGQGRSVSRIIQGTSGANGIVFNSTTGSNRVTSATGIRMLFQVSGFSLVRKDGTNGGVGIKAAWTPSTDNAVYFKASDLNIEYDTDTTAYWTKGIELTEVNGSRIDDISIRGDSANSSTTTSAAAYNMTHGIHYTGGTTWGKIDHFITNINGGECNDYFVVDGWYEGFYITGGEIVHANRAFSLTGYATVNNPNFHVQNVHGDVRTSYVKATNINNLRLINCDAYKGGGITGVGFTGSIVDITACPNFMCQSSKLENIHTSATNGLLAQGTCVNGKFVGNIVINCNQTAFALSGTCTEWTEGSNTYSINGTAIYTSSTATNNTIGNNAYGSNTTKVNDSGGNYRVKRQYNDSVVLNLAGAAAGASLTVSIPLPSNYFQAKPSSGMVLQSGGGIIGFYNYSDSGSTSTNAVVELRDINAAAISAGSARFSVSFTE